MRRLIIAAFTSLIAALALAGCRPSEAVPSATLSPATLSPATLSPATFAPELLTATVFPADSTLLPTFVPPYPCALENVEVDVQQTPICRNESVKESILAQGDGVIFIQHDYSMGAGCFGSISENLHELRICTQSSGASQILTSNLTSGVIPSPDGKWFAFGVALIRNAILPQVYRIRSNGTDVQRLDTQGFPVAVVGSVQVDSWSADGLWVNISGWDGSTGRYSARIKADGSGAYDSVTHATYTPAPTFPPQPTAAPPTRGTPFIGTPHPQPTATPLPN